MRHQWRLFLFRNSHLRYSSPPTHLQGHFNSLRSLFFFLHNRSLLITSPEHQKHLCCYPQPKISPNPTNLVNRTFSSESVVEVKDSDHVLATEIFNRMIDNSEIKKELDSIGVVISHDLGLKVLRGLESSPVVAKRFFNWVLDTDCESLSPKSYNLMLSILGVNGLLDDFWELVDTMKKKGYGVSARVRDKVGEKFQNDGLEADLERLKAVFASNSMDNPMEKICTRVCKILRTGDWSADVEKHVTDLKVEFSSDLVKMVVENLNINPRKALLFFRWIGESGLFKHDEKTYNAIAKVIGREKFLDRFWNIIAEMRSAGYEMEIETYVQISARFCQSKMIKEAVELFEFAMAGSKTPAPHYCTLLLKKIVTAKKLNMNLFSRAVKAYAGNDNALTDSMLNSILKSLRSVDRFGQSNEFFKAMKEGGYTADGDLESKIAVGLSRAGRKGEVSVFENFMEAYGENLDIKALASLVERHCVDGELEMALVCFNKMVGKQGISHVGYALEKLVLAYCKKNQRRDAYKLLCEYVKENKLKPWHNTYKVLIRNLLSQKVSSQGGFKDALSLLPLMKDHGFPPFVDPFLDYVSETGTSDDAFAFLKAMTSKKFPSTSMVLRVFGAMLKGERYNEAQHLLAKSPSYIRVHPDVLELFNSMKSAEGGSKKAVPA